MVRITEMLEDGELHLQYRFFSMLQLELVAGIDEMADKVGDSDDGTYFLAQEGR